MELDTFSKKSSEKVAIAVAEPIPAPIVSAQKPIIGSSNYTAAQQEYLSNHKLKSSYVYDPSVAANELGLPVDLIEEFIGDFIQQSHEFKDELFEAAVKSDFNALHILSHKLKGVAANLRVENALESLTAINSSTEPVEIEANLKYYYDIIAKLEGKEAVSAPTTMAQTAPAKKDETKPSQPISLDALDEIYSFSLKQEDNKSLIVDQEDTAQEDIPFKKDFFELNDESDEDELSPKESVIAELPVTLHYDAKAVGGALGVELSFMEELLHDYKIDASAMNATIIQAIKSFDTHTWRSSAAKLKGISDNLRLSEISDELAILSVTNDAQEAKKSFLRLTGYLDQL